MCLKYTLLICTFMVAEISYVQNVKAETGESKQIQGNAQLKRELQTFTDSPKTKSAVLKTADSTIAKKLNAALALDSAKTTVGCFVLKKKKLLLKGDLIPTPIKSVKFYVQDGLIKGFRLYMSNGLMYYTDNFIALSYFEKYDQFNLYSGNSLDTVNPNPDVLPFVKLHDFLAYVTVTGNDYIPDNSNFELKPDGKETAEAKLSSGINNIIDVRTYTDFLGLLNKESNGIAQFEGSTKIITWNNTFKKAQFFNYIRPTFKWVRFDENEKGVIYDSISKDPNIKLIYYNRNKIFQKVNIDLGFDLNIIRFHYSTKAILDLSMQTNFSYVSLISKNDQTNTGNLWSYGPKLSFSIPKSKNYSFSSSAEYLRQRLTRGSGYEANDYNGIGNADSKPFYRIQCELDYFPFENENNQIFLRFISTNGFKSNDKGFNQFQIGSKYNLKL